MRDTSKTLQGGRLLSVARWLMAAVLSCLAGCQPLSLRSPVPRSVATSRQLTQQGALAIERGDWSRGEALLAQAVAACAADAEARRRYAEALWRRGEAAQAIAQVEEARRLTPEDVELAVLAGGWHLALGRDRQALAAAEAALAIDRRHAPALTLRGRVYQGAGDLREALASFQRALSFSPGDREALLQLAEAHRQLNQPERALVALQSLIDGYPPGEEPQAALYLEGLALGALGRHDGACAALAACLGRGEPTPEILFQLAAAQAKAGRAVDAQEAANRALSLDPGHAASRELLDSLHIALRAGSARR